MKWLVLTACIACAVFSTSAMAGEADKFIGRWSATQNGQTISWDIAKSNTATFYKNGVASGNAPWVLNADGTISIKAPPGDFIAKELSSDSIEIAPPAALNSSPEIFRKE